MQAFMAPPSQTVTLSFFLSCFVAYPLKKPNAFPWLLKHLASDSDPLLHPLVRLTVGLQTQRSPSSRAFFFSPSLCWKPMARYAPQAPLANLFTSDWRHPQDNPRPLSKAEPPSFFFLWTWWKPKPPWNSELLFIFLYSPRSDKNPSSSSILPFYCPCLHLSSFPYLVMPTKLANVDPICPRNMLDERQVWLTTTSIMAAAAALAAQSIIINSMSTRQHKQLQQCSEQTQGSLRAGSWLGLLWVGGNGWVLEFLFELVLNLG